MKIIILSIILLIEKGICYMELDDLFQEMFEMINKARVIIKFRNLDK